MEQERDNEEAGASIVREGEGSASGSEQQQQAIVEYEKLLDRLSSLSQTFGTARDLITIIRALRDFAIGSTPCNGIFVSLYDQERNLRTAVYAWGEGEEVDLSMLPPLPMSNSPHSRAIATGQIIITDDYLASLADQPTIHIVAGNLDPRLPRSSLVTPMAFMGRILGAVEVQSAELAAFRSEHVTAMRMAASLAGVAIENVRLLKRELERAEAEAESEKMRSLGQLAAGVAHDFNNALAAILGRTQLLLRTTTDEKQQRNLQIIETAALDAAETVRRIQTFARRTPGEQLSNVSVAKLISDAVQLTRTRWEDDGRAHGVKYQIEFTPDIEGDEITANPSELREVLVNLIFNALDAMPQGGRIDLRESKLDDLIVVEVADTGHGVPQALRDRIFEPFFTTKGPQGSGLGLAISYGIIHRHGGTIEVESEEGRGTTFRLTFPQTRHAAATDASTSRRAILPPRRVLVVDDEQVVREVLVEMLRTLRQQVVAVSSGQEALERLARERFDLMITDLSMPEMDGLNLAAEARRIAPRMLIALSTGYGQTIPHGTPDPALINKIVNKPFQISDLEASLLALYSHTPAR